MATSDRAFPRINLEQCRKQAKDLLKRFNEGDPKALDHVRWNHPRFKRMSDTQIRAGEFTLADAQLVIAHLHHLESWPKLLHFIESIEQADPAVSQFENAADAIISGNLPALQFMLRDSPGLIRQRSTRKHNSTLLHYVSANGVEDNRQITPPNIVDIARFLLNAGAEVDAESTAYGGGSTTLGLTATSAHPRLAGVQLALIDLLVERGAVIGPIDTKASMPRNCLANGCPEAAVHLLKLGAKPDNLYGAAALGDVNAVQQLLPQTSDELRNRALLVAAQCDALAVVTLLLENGANVHASDGMTALHWASGNANILMIELLLRYGASLETENDFGGTVLSNTLWFAYNATPADFKKRNYPAVIERLIVAGARTDFYPEMQAEIEGVYQRAKR